MAPEPMDDTILPSTVTEADFTFWTTNLIENIESKIARKEREKKIICIEEGITEGWYS
jgi:transketolase C-terminal domain/subunit